MGKWEYTLKFGKALRDAINSDDPDRVIDALVACFTEINKTMPTYFDSGDLQETLAELEDYRDSLYNYDKYDMTYEEAVDNVDYMLEKLYDMCDDLRIWVEILI